MNWEQQFADQFIAKLVAPSTQVWFGVFEFGDFVKCGDSFPMAIIRRVDAKITMNPDDADDYMVENGFDSYLVPSQFNGEIYYSKEEGEENDNGL